MWDQNVGSFGGPYSDLLLLVRAQGPGHRPVTEPRPGRDRGQQPVGRLYSCRLGSVMKKASNHEVHDF